MLEGVSPPLPSPTTQAESVGTCRSLPEPLLPPELPWLYVAIPLPAAYLLRHDLLNSPLPLLIFFVKTYLPFVAFGTAFHLLYRSVMPQLLRRAHSFPRRSALHVAAVLLVVPAVSAVLLL